MNLKTTLSLMLVLVVLVMGLYIVRSSPRADENASLAASPLSPSAAEQDLLEEGLGDVVKVECRRKDEEEWVFEKIEPDDGGDPGWHMIAPQQFKAVSWEVDKFERQLGALTYQISHEPGQPGAVTADEAGLDPPRATVTLSDAEGNSATVQIGKPASEQSTYIRLDGSDRIYVGNSSLSNLFKAKAFEYRNRELFRFDIDDVTRLEIIDRSKPSEPITYAFVPDGARWMMESPVTARATSKVADALRSLSILNAVQWVDDASDRRSVFGLDSAALTIRIRVEREVQTPDPEDTDGDAAAEPDEDPQSQEQGPPKIEIKTYELHIADRWPIGEETKRYLRLGDESAVATIMKTTADRFRPVMQDWRDMQVSSADVTAATRIALTTPQGSATLVKDGDRWSFAADDSPAEASVVTGLLNAIRDLKAVAFVEPKPDELPSMGFDAPRVDIRLTIAGVDGEERITVGGHTDATTKRLTYVRRNESGSLSKVKSSDIQALIEGPLAYRDRAILNLPSDGLERITLSTVSPCTDERMTITLAKDEGAWSMVEPVSAPVRSDRIEKLVEALGGLRAEKIVTEADELSAYGLHTPSATVTVTVQPPTQYRIEESTEDADDGEPPSDEEDAEDAPTPAAKTVEVRPPPQTWEMILTKHEGRFFAKRSDRRFIYAVSGDFYGQLFEEYRKPEVWTFDRSDVQRFSIRNGDSTHVFVRREERWVYQAEPDLPIDPKKIDDLLGHIHNLKTERFVRYGVDVPDELGLSPALIAVQVTLADGSEHFLKVSGKRCTSGAQPGFYAMIQGQDGVFLLDRQATAKLNVSLDDLE